MASESIKKSTSKYSISSVFLNIGRWVNDRWPLAAFIRFSSEEEIPGGASFAYIFGSATLITFLLQIVTGICQLFYYVPTIDHAYDSLNYLRTGVPFGWLIHSLHYWGASAMVLLIGLHMVRVFIWGAYKHPRELTWLVGVSLLLVTLGISFTGPTLAWDERGYWVAEVGTSIAGTVPVVGDWAKQLLRGGAAMGQLTLSRFFILHVAILPGILLALISIHLIAFRRFGISGPWDETKRKDIGLFWPDQIFDDTVITTFLCFILIALSVYASAPITGPADPLDTSYVPKPEWNFLFLYEALKFFPGRLEPIGTVGVASFIILLLVFLPFIGRRAERNPRKRPFAIAGGLIFVLIVLSLAIAGHYSKGTGTVSIPSKPVALVAHMSESAREGAKLFKPLSCNGCHRVNAMGGTIGPDLSSESLKGRSHQWLFTQIQNPKANDPKTIMPAFTSLPHQQINALVDYLQSLQYGSTPPPKMMADIGGGKEKPASVRPVVPTRATTVIENRYPLGPPGQAAGIIGSADHGAILFKQDCESCHGPQGTDKVPNPGSDDGTVPPLNPIDPSLFHPDPQVFAENIDRFIQHGSIPSGKNPQLHMPVFGDTNTLTQQATSNIEAYVLRLNGVDRAQLAHPGIQPLHFFWLAVVVFGLVGLGFSSLWIRMRLRVRRSTSGVTTIKGPLPADQVESTRRGFLKLATGTITFLVGLAVGVPIIGTVVGPVFRTKRPYWAKVGELNSLPVGKPVKLTFASQTASAYIRETVLRNVWAIRHPTSEITVFSPICPHLGCEYNWNPQSNHFECPCHGSTFAFDGKVLGGPAPRPLDALPTRVDGGNLFVEWKTFKIGIPQKIAV